MLFKSKTKKREREGVWKKNKVYHPPKYSLEYGHNHVAESLVILGNGHRDKIKFKENVQIAF